jgi:uncharacterized membrane protein
MAPQTTYPTTYQGVRDPDNPITPGASNQVSSTRQQNVGPNERAASVIAGGVIVGYGPGRQDLAGLVIAALATGLICRGVTGHCAVYQAAAINTAR